MAVLRLLPAALRFRASVNASGPRLRATDSRSHRLERADELWKDLEAATCQKLRDVSGPLTFSAESAPATRIALQSAELLRDRLEVMTADEARLRFPTATLLPVMAP